ncbi:MAG: prepilin-type N-terminal cleavage/methylation domain-containing protein [Pseudomonadota bacterium]
MKNISRKMQYGFTLLEMVLVVLLLSIVAGISSHMLSGGFNAYLIGKDAVEADWQVRNALEWLMRDLRAVRSATAADLTITPSNAITFTDTSGAVVSYSVSGSTLMRNGQPLADGVASLSFSYIQKDGKNTASSVGQVYYIVVQLGVTQNGINKTLRATIRPRSIS